MNDRGGRQTHRFSNGIEVFTSDLAPEQLERYRQPGGQNLHEPVEEHWLRALIEAYRDQSRITFLDVGCAIGYYCVLVRRMAPDAYICAVDATPGFRERFYATLRLNSIDGAGIDHRALAVYPHAREVRITDRHFGSRVAVGDEDGELVPAVALPELIDSIGRRIDVCKMDVQTAELPILLHALGRLAPGQVGAWIVGTHGPTIHARLITLFEDSAHAIVFEDPSPAGQPDGIIVAVPEGSPHANLSC